MDLSDKDDDIQLTAMTWNCAGQDPEFDPSELATCFQSEPLSDIIVIGLQEVIPLTAVTVLVTKDDEDRIDKY